LNVPLKHSPPMKIPDFHDTLSSGTLKIEDK